jgi:hypothetical protein
VHLCQGEFFFGAGVGGGGIRLIQLVGHIKKKVSVDVNIIIWVCS